MGAITQLTAVAQPNDGVLRIASGHADQALGIPGRFSDDIDDTVDRIRAPQASSWSSDDFNTLDVFKQQILDFPVHAGEGWSVDRPSVHQHQQLVGETSVKPSNGDRPFVGVDPRHLHPWRQPQRVWNISHPTAANIVLGDDKHC